MIACAGYYGYLEKNFADMTLNAIPSLTSGDTKNRDTKKEY